MLKRSCLLLALPLFLAACGTTDQQRADYNAVQSSGVSPAIYDKMIHDDDLGINDIAALGRARVNDGIIVRYIRDHDTVYHLDPGQIDYLQKSGVSASVIDYMVQTGRQGGGIPISIGIGVGGGFGYGGGGYGGGGYRR